MPYFLLVYVGCLTFCYNMSVEGQCTMQKTSQVFDLVRSDYVFSTDVHCGDVSFFQHMFASKGDEICFGFIHFKAYSIHPGFDIKYG